MRADRVRGFHSRRPSLRSRDHRGTRGRVFDVAVHDSILAAASAGAGLNIFDVSDPQHPIVIGSYDITGYASIDYVEFVGDMVIASYFEAPPVRDYFVFDLHDPAHPSLVRTVTTDSRSGKLSLDGDVIYVEGKRGGDPGIQALDVSDPTDPSELWWMWLPNPVEDLVVSDGVAYVIGDNICWTIDAVAPGGPMVLGSVPLPAAPKDVAVEGTNVFVTTGTELLIIDASDPHSPQIVGTLPLPSGCVVVANQVATVCGDELYCVDVADPSNPTILGSTQPPYPLGGSKLVQDGNLVYEASVTRGIVVYDVSDPTSPVAVGWEDPPDQAWSVCVSEGLALVEFGAQSQAGSDLTLINVQDPSHPDSLRTVRVGWDSTSVQVDQDGLYYVSSTDAGVQVLDWSDPESPSFIGSLPTPDAAYQCAIVGDIAYIAVDDNGLLIADISDPTNPVEIGSVDLPGKASAIDVSGGYAYVGCNIGAVGQLQVVDVSDPTVPVAIGSYTDGTDYVADVDVLGDRLYLSESQSGIRVLDVSDASSPVLANMLPIDPEGAENTVLSDGFMVVTGREGGVYRARLFIYELSDPDHPTLLGSCELRDFAYGLAVDDAVAYVADVESGLVTVALRGCSGPVCPADLATPYGQLDFSDVLAFLTAFGTMDPAADLAEPFGDFDFSDVLSFLIVFGGGCP